MEKAQKTLYFNKKNLIESYNVLLDAKRDGRGVFSVETEECFDILPKGVARGSKEHASFLFFMSIADKFAEARVLFRKGRAMFEKNPEAFDAEQVFEADKDQLKIHKRKDGSRMLMAPTIGRMIKEELEHGLWIPLSGDWYRSARKLARVYDSDPRKMFDGVTDFGVALRRLDAGKPAQPIEKEIEQRTLPKFRGFGEAKVAPLLIMWFERNGFIEGMDRSDMHQPFDTHALNFTIGRGIAKPRVEMRVATFAKYAQVLFQETFKRQGMDPIEFHTAQWRMGSDVCTFADCYNRKTVEDQRLCPYMAPCREFLDVQKYRMGIVACSTSNIFAQ